MPVERLGAFLSSVIQHHAMSVLEERLNLAALATASSKPGYEETGIAGAWALAARLALKDFNGVEDAFRKHPYSLGVDKMRFEHAKTWLFEKGFSVSDVNWSQADAELSGAVYTAALADGAANLRRLASPRSENGALFKINAGL